MKDFAKAGWKAAPLGEVAQIRPDKKEAKSVLADADDVSFVPMDCLRVDQVALAEHEARPLGKVYGGYTYFRDGDVLLAKITPCFENGKLGIANDLTNGVGFGSSEFFVLRPNERLLAGYLYHFLNRQSFRDWAKGQMTGAVGHKRVPKELVEALDIPLPPLEEQQRIVAVLDEAFEGLARARAHAEANLKNARELFGSILAALVTNGNECPTELLGDICEFQGGTQPPKSQFVDAPREGYVRLLQIRDFKSDDKAVYVADNKKVKKCEASDIMIGRYGASVGQIHRGKAGAYNVALVKTIPDDKRLDRDYFYYYLTSDLFQKPLLSKSSRGAQDGFNQADISPFPVPVPTLKEQRRVVEILDQQSEGVRHLSLLYQRKLSDLDDLRQSLLQKAFAGELT